jgi:hypothetical protein
MAPDIKEDISPIITVVPHKRETYPVYNDVFENIVPITDPKAINPPSTQKKATKRST